MQLGVGTHFGEWWGGGIQRNYGLAKDDKRFSLFNVARWEDGATKTIFERQVPIEIKLSPRPACCGVVPVLYKGLFNTVHVNTALWRLEINGSAAVPGFMKPEGIVVFHTAANRVFKVLLENDENPKSE